MQEKQKKELFSQFYEQHLKAKYEKAPRYTLEEIAAHNTEQDCWTVVHGKVYNIAPFIAQHPGGKKILRAAGIDGTEIFSKPFLNLNVLIETFHKNIKLDETMLALLFEGFLVGSEEDVKNADLLTKLMAEHQIA